MKLLPLICSVLLIASCPSFADQTERFFEFPFGADQTRVYDLSTVRVIQPGRFTVVSTLIADANRMAFELKVLDALRTYCKGPDGKYPPPADLFTLGPPDLPVRNIEVKSTSPSTRWKYESKIASWSYPYKRLAIEDRGEFSQERTFFACKDLAREEWDLYRDKRAEITNGERRRELFDCKRALHDFFGVPFVDGKEPSAALMRTMMRPEPVKPHTMGLQLYRDICLRVTHETPYSPE
jgi:hypothetical protein